MNGQETGVPALISIDPLSKNNFLTDTVFGKTRQVYKFDGNISPSQNAGLYLPTSNILDSDDAYSIEMIFKFEDNHSDWKNILGVSNRQSDNALYVDPQQKIEVWPSGDGPDNFLTDEYYHIVLTNNGLGQTTTYLNGITQFNLTTTSMNFSAYSQVNPDRLVHFFADNLTGGGLNEFSDGRIALIRLYDLELTLENVRELNENPFPAPSIAALLYSIGLLLD